MKKILFYFLLCAYVAPITLAKDQLIIQKKIYKTTDVIKVSFEAKCLASVVTYVASDFGNVQYLNEKTGVWLNMPANWNSGLTFENSFYIRVLHIDDKKVKLTFYFLNRQTGTIEKIDTDIWISNAYLNYIDSLNSSIMIQ